MPANPRKGQVGFQPATMDPERRAFFDTLRESESLRDRVSTIEGGLVTVSTGTYTPTLGNLVVGTAGTNTATYTYIGDASTGLMTVHGRILFGSAGQTFPGASSETVSLPSGFQIASHFADGLNFLGNVCVIDADSTDFTGHLRWSSNTTLRFVLEQDGAGVGANNIAIVDFTSGDPIATWAQGDGFDWTTVAMQVVRV